jgi:hypothetical protein
VSWSPVFTADLSGGYSRFSGDRLEGPNGALLFVPGIKVGDNFSFLPIMTADYQKARDVQELAGGGFLTVAQHSRGISLRAIETLGPVKLKAYGGFKQNFLKETRDEAWGKGLFDYDKTAGGLEVEGRGPAIVESWRAGVDYYLTKFPNFESLASRQAGAEINAGKNVLDFNSVDLPLAADLSLGRQRLELRLLTSLRDFTDQNVVDAGGTFSSKKRRDLYWSFSAAGTRLLPKTSLFGTVESSVGLDAAYNVLNSDQNSYDVASVTFHPDFYSYNETAVGPRYRFRWRGWMTGGLSYLMAFRDYTKRPAQDLSGADKGAAITTRTQTFRFALTFPVMQGIAVQLQGATQHADSNMAFETTYRYNYSSSNYFLGVSYEL